MNYQNNDMIDGICKYFNRIDLLMFSHINKRFNRYSKTFIVKYKNNVAKFNRNYMNNNVIICINAAYEGYLNVLIYLRENNYNWNLYVCADAALNGHLDILKWARQNDCEWNSHICAYAAQNGYLDILKRTRIRTVLRKLLRGGRKRLAKLLPDFFMAK